MAKKKAEPIQHPSDAPRTCVFCKHFVIHEAERGWSEYTPGESAYMECKKHHFNETLNYVSQLDFVQCLKMAATCRDYKPE